MGFKVMCLELSEKDEHRVQVGDDEANTEHEQELERGGGGIKY